MTQYLLRADALPWQPLKPGFSMKLLHTDIEADMRVQLLRLEPGTVIERHRHEGAVHAYNLVGQRLLLDTRELVGPGGYVYEPPGNVDSWMAVGEEPVIVFVTLQGALSYLDERDEVRATNTTRATAESYQRFVAEQVGATAR
ncbi:MAG: anti-sigma factor [Kofleriaceae bacterium]|nr:anti-sigma factor [Kofleriaceae bacterium]